MSIPFGARVIVRAVYRRYAYGERAAAERTEARAIIQAVTALRGVGQSLESA